MNQVERKVIVANLEQDKQTESNENLEQEAEKLTSANDQEINKTEEQEVVAETVESDKEEAKETEPVQETEEVSEESSESESIGEAEDDAEETQQELQEATEEDSEEEATHEEGSALDFYKDILAKAEEFVTQNDWAFVANELANLNLKVEDGPDTDDDAVKSILAKFEELKEDFEERRKAHYEELNQRKAENLEAKKGLLKQLSDIVTEEKWSATNEVKHISNKWENIKPIPQSEVDALNEKFNALIEEFESHKVDRLVKKLQKEEENLTFKLVLLDKIENIVATVKDETADFEELEKELNDLQVQWRKIGRVPADKNQQTWDSYYKAIDTFNDLRFKFDKKYRETIEKALEKKQKLIKEAEALIDLDDIAKAARRVNKLHKIWKKTGNLPQKEENELWEKFKAATDSFNDKKSDNIDTLREQEQENYNAKLKLIDQAVAIQDTENFEQGHQQLQKLMDEWKKIGPVPRKKSSKIWKQFKSAMDVFYDKRREHFKDVRKDQKDNLNRKNEILAKLKELGEHDDPAAAVEEAKKLQDEFKQIGYVPLKYKNKIWKEYREVCDTIYGNYRSSGSDLGKERKLASQGFDPAERKEIIKFEKEIDELKKESSKLESEIIQYQEAKTYFKPTNKGNKLRDELQEKIDKAEAVLDEKAERISELRKKLSELRTQDDD
tara:strand:+ start:101630 stop:103645 length:2016 start_codon:yes stop_codon:yes gene_type:complete